MSHSTDGNETRDQTNTALLFSSLLFSKQTKPRDVERMRFEVRVLKHMKHVNTVRYITDMETSSRLYLVMEFCPRGDLTVYLESRKNTLSEVRTTTNTNDATSSHNQNELTHTNQQPRARPRCSSSRYTRRFDMHITTESFIET